MSSTILDLSERGLPYAIISQELQRHFSDDRVRDLPATLILKKNFLSKDGTIALSEDWLASGAMVQVVSLDISSCSVGRFQDTSLGGAFRLTELGCMKLGEHGARLVQLNLAWNDIEDGGLEALVRGLLDITGPQFSDPKTTFAASVDPKKLVPERSCALRSLNLEGNSVGDAGAFWLAFLLNCDSNGNNEAGGLERLVVRQCALEAGSAEVLAKAMVGTQMPRDEDTEGRKSNSITCRLTHLNMIDNDLGVGSAAIANAAIDLSLVEFNGNTAWHINSAKLPLESETTTTEVTLKPGEDSMAHGVLAALISIRNESNPKEEGNPKCSGCDVILDLRSTQASGYYSESDEAFVQLVALLQAQREGYEQDRKVEQQAQTVNPLPPTQEYSIEPTVKNMEGNSNTSGDVEIPRAAQSSSATALSTVESHQSSQSKLTQRRGNKISTILLNDETGFNSWQVAQLAEVCSADGISLLYNGAPCTVASKWWTGCYLQ